MNCPCWKFNSQLFILLALFLESGDPALLTQKPGWTSQGIETRLGFQLLFFSIICLCWFCSKFATRIVSALGCYCWVQPNRDSLNHRRGEFPPHDPALRVPLCARFPHQACKPGCCWDLMFVINDRFWWLIDLCRKWAISGRNEFVHYQILLWVRVHLWAHFQNFLAPDKGVWYC